MYERNYSSPMGGDLYRLQQEARRREGDTEDFVEHNPPRHRPEKDIRYDNKEYSHFDNKRPENILEAKNIKPHKKKGGRDIFGKLFSNITIEDIILLGIILLLLQEDENNEIIIILAVILFMGLK